MTNKVVDVIWIGLLVVCVFYGGFMAGTFYEFQQKPVDDSCQVVDLKVVNKSDVSVLVGDKPVNRSYELCRDLETGEKFLCSERID